MTYTHWSDNEPNEASKSCLKMAANSQDVIWWEDEACDTTLPYICHIGKLFETVQYPSYW